MSYNTEKSPKCPKILNEIGHFPEYFIKFNNEQYHQKLKHSCNFDKKQRSKTNVFVSKTIY